MKSIARRTFLKTTSQACLGGCLLMSASAFGSHLLLNFPEEKPDPELLNYCGYTCPEGCEFKKATLENDLELKKESFKAWKIEERYNQKFDAEKAFCYGCKVPDKPAGAVTANCTVRSCAKEKGYEACIQCKELTSCEKDLWKRFPEFYEQVVEMQKKYLST